MPSPISSRDASGDFTPYYPEDDVCSAAKGLSATIGSVGVMAGEITDGSDNRPSEKILRSFLEGDSIGASAAVGIGAGVTNAADAGTATEVGVGMVQAEVHFQHSWHLADLPLRW